MNFIDITHSKEHSIQITKPGETVLFLYNASKEITIDLLVKDAEVKIFGVFVGTNNESYKLHVTQHHVEGLTTSNLLVKGVFKHQSRFEYEGLIRIEEGAQQSAAYQKNQNLMMSEDATVSTRPFLEILANDVFCTHGATTGKASADQMNYVQARGVKKDEAEKVIAEGFILEVFQKLEESGIIEEVCAYKEDALKKIHA